MCARVGLRWMSRIPTLIDVGPYTYRVVSDELCMLRKEKELETGLYGYTDHLGLEIGIAQTVAVDNQTETLLHEVLHCITRMMGLDWTTEDEEKVIKHLSPLLLDTLRRNPGLVAYLLNQEENK